MSNPRILWSKPDRQAYRILSGLSMLILFASVSTLALADEPAAESGFPALSIPFSIGAMLPVGTSSSFFDPGMFLEAGPALRLGENLGTGLHLGISALPLSAGPTLVTVGADIGVQYAWSVLPRLTLTAAGTAGGYWAGVSGADPDSILAGSGGFGTAASARLGLEFQAGSAWSFAAGPRFKAMFGLHYGVAVSAGARWSPGKTISIGALSTDKQARKPPAEPASTADSDGLSAKGVVLGRFELEPVFPVFYSYYNTTPFGTLTVKNNERSPVSDLRIAYSMKQYMDAPAVLVDDLTLLSGQEQVVPIQGLFNDAILSITEGTLVATEFAVSYVLAGRQQAKTFNVPVRILDRNSMSWFDDRCAAAYVTAKDPVILNFAKNVTGSVAGRESFTLNRSLQAAVAIHTALELYGMNYLVDPKSSYAALSGTKGAIDFLQFPRQTMEFRSGDCDDLAILYAALLEAAGVETAFITTPGHIYLALALEMTEEETRRVFPANGDFIIMDGKTWLPLEITERRGGFIRAWQLGASQWREHAAKGKAELHPVREAWKVFSPVAMPGSGTPVVPPRGPDFDTRYDEAIRAIIARELAPQESRWLEEIQKTQGSARARNSLGLLYARYGVYDKAEAEFTAILKDRAYLPAMINAGNIALIRRDYPVALRYYSEARSMQDGQLSAIVGMLLAQYELGNHAAVAQLHTEITRIDPAMAANLAYTVSTGISEGRASATLESKETVLWTE